jgi:hypothetical protein
LDTENSVATRRDVQARQIDSGAVTDVADVSQADYFPTLDAVTRRILKAMYDTLERAANEAELRAQLENQQQLKAEEAQQAQSLVGSALQNTDNSKTEQNIRLLGQAQDTNDGQAQNTGDIPGASRKTASDAPILVGQTKAKDAPLIPGEPAPSAEQSAPAPQAVKRPAPAPSVGAAEGRVILQKVTQALKQAKAPDVAILHDFRPSAPAPERVS